MADRETVFTLEATPVKFGPGAVDDAGWELSASASPGRCSSPTPASPRRHAERVRASIEAEGIEVVVYDRARVEPTLDSLPGRRRLRARRREVDGFVSVGGGSAIDTAKVADLIVSHPAPVMDYVNAPIGGGRKPPAPLRPHLAIPTTSGTGCEATTVAVLDIPELQREDRHLAPLPAACAGDRRPRAGAHAARRGGRVDRARRRLPRRRVVPLAAVRPPRRGPPRRDDRPPYQGANPVADVWSAKALEYGGATCAARSPTPTTSRRAAR